jgi:hypothetical protein
MENALCQPGQKGMSTSHRHICSLLTLTKNFKRENTYFFNGTLKPHLTSNSYVVLWTLCLQFLSLSCFAIGVTEADGFPSVYSSALYAYDFPSNAWRLASPALLPAPRAYHSCTVYVNATKIVPEPQSCLFFRWGDHLSVLSIADPAL